MSRNSTPAREPMMMTISCPTLVGGNRKAGRNFDSPVVFGSVEARPDVTGFVVPADAGKLDVRTLASSRTDRVEVDKLFSVPQRTLLTAQLTVIGRVVASVDGRVRGR
jgi:hypothetical protein